MKLLPKILDLILEGPLELLENKNPDLLIRAKVYSTEYQSSVTLELYMNMLSIYLTAGESVLIAALTEDADLMVFEQINAYGKSYGIPAKCTEEQFFQKTLVEDLSMTYNEYLDLYTKTDSVRQQLLRMYTLSKQEKIR